MSPGDVSEERDALTSLVTLWNAQVGRGLNARVDLVRWESHTVPDMSMPAQQAINEQLLNDCDFGIGVFWSKLGTATTKHPSGSVEEIFSLLQKGARVLVYFCNRPIPQSALQTDQFAKLQDLKKTFSARGLYAEYSDVSSLRDQVQLHLTNIVSQLLAKDRGATTFLPTSGSLTAPTPDVRVEVNPHLIKDFNPLINEVTSVLGVTVQNHSPAVVYVTNISFELKDGKRLMVTKDAVTGNFQSKVELNPGNSFTFYVDPESLRNDEANLVCAIAVDAIGRVYRSSETSFPLVAKLLLMQNKR